MSHKLGMLAIMGAAALFGVGTKGMYNLDKDYSSSGLDISSINKARRMSRRNKSVRRSRKKR
jgi:hypothetical protein